MTKTSPQLILQEAAHLFANSGMDGFSIRKLAKQIPITPSVLYHHFDNEDVLLRAMFDYLNHTLGDRRSLLPKVKSASQMLKQRIEFQIDNQEEIVAVLKYYLSFRHNFDKYKNGFVPDKSALHIEEVLSYGIETGEFYVKNLSDDSKVITHAINGFLLEYHPYKPSGIEKKDLIDRIHNFLLRALRKEVK